MPRNVRREIHRRRIGRDRETLRDPQPRTHRGARDANVRSRNQRAAPGCVIPSRERQQRMGENLHDIVLRSAGDRAGAAVRPNVGVCNELTI